MKTQQYQFTLYLPDEANQPTVAAPKDNARPPKTLSIREAAHLYTCKIKDLPVAEQPISRLQHYGSGMLNTSELLAIILGAPYVAASAYVGQDGKPHASLEVTAESVRFLGGKNGANGVTGQAQDESEMDIDENEIPF